jgi:hypothetical protein
MHRGAKKVWNSTFQIWTTRTDLISSLWAMQSCQTLLACKRAMQSIRIPIKRSQVSRLFLLKRIRIYLRLVIARRLTFISWIKNRSPFNLYRKGRIRSKNLFKTQNNDLRNVTQNLASPFLIWLRPKSVKRLVKLWLKCPKWWIVIWRLQL